MYNLLKSYSLIFVLKALLILSADDVPKLNREQNKFNPFIFDISTQETQQILIGMVGTDISEEEKGEREEMVNERCTGELGNNHHLIYFANVAQFSEWMNTDIIDPEKKKNMQQLQKFIDLELKEKNQLKPHIHALRNLCQSVFDTLFGIPTCPLYSRHFCTNEYCEKVKHEHGIEGNCQYANDVNSKVDDGIFAKIFAVDPFVSLCVIDELYVCQEAKQINAFESGFDTSAINTDIVSIKNDELVKEYKMSKKSGGYILQKGMASQKMILDGKTDYLVNLEINGYFSSLLGKFGIIDMSIKGNHKAWSLLNVLDKSNTVWFYYPYSFYSMNMLFKNTNGKFEDIAGFGDPDPLSFGEQFSLLYNATKDCMILVRPSKKIQNDIICKWSTFANEDSEFYFVFETYIYPGFDVSIKFHKYMDIKI